MHGSKIAVIIPALNEEKAIGNVVEDTRRIGISEIVVVDNGSMDRTAETAKKHGARVVFEPVKGYGSACLAGLNSLSDAPPDIVVFMEGDYSDRPEEIERLVGFIEREGFDFVIGSRIMGQREKGALPVYSIFANRVFAVMVRLLYGLKLTDIGSFRAVKYTSLMSLGMADRGYGFSIEMVVKAAKKRLKIKEVPTSFRKRIGTSKITGNTYAAFSAGIKIFYTLFRFSLKK